MNTFPSMHGNVQNIPANERNDIARAWAIALADLRLVLELGGI